MERVNCCHAVARTALSGVGLTVADAATQPAGLGCGPALLALILRSFRTRQRADVEAERTGRLPA